MFDGTVGKPCSPISAKSSPSASSMRSVGNAGLIRDPHQLSASTTDTLTLTTEVTVVDPSTTIFVTVNGTDPVHHSTIITTTVVSKEVIVPVYTFMPTPTYLPSHSITDECFPVSSTRPIMTVDGTTQHASVDCHCNCGTTTDVVWWGTDVLLGHVTSWCTGGSPTYLPSSAPANFTTVYTGCAVPMPTATPACWWDPPDVNQTAMDVSAEKLMAKANQVCDGNANDTVFFPLAGDKGGDVGGMLIQNGERYHHAFAPDEPVPWDIWLNFTMAWSDTPECQSVENQVAPGRSWCAGIFNQSYLACYSSNAMMQTGCLNWTIEQGFA